MRAQVRGLTTYLREKRIELHLTQLEVSEAIGHVTSQYVSNYERGLCEPSVKMAIIICKFLKISKPEIHKVMVEHYDEKIAAALGIKKNKGQFIADMNHN